MNQPELQRTRSRAVFNLTLLANELRGLEAERTGPFNAGLAARLQREQLLQQSTAEPAELAAKLAELERQIVEADKQDLAAGVAIQLTGLREMQRLAPARQKVFAAEIKAVETKISIYEKLVLDNDERSKVLTAETAAAEKEVVRLDEEIALAQRKLVPAAAAAVAV